MSSPRTFLYRFPRFKANHRMDFICGDTVLLGLCTEISDSGLCGKVFNTVPDGSEGLLTIYTDNRSFSAHAIMLSVRDGEATAKFAFASQEEQAAIRELSQLLRPDPNTEPLP